MNRTAYACLVFDIKRRRVEGWEIYSAPGDQITCLGNRVVATITEADGTDYEDAVRNVTRVMERVMPGIPPGERLVAVDANQDAKMVEQALKCADAVAWMRGLLALTADESEAKNFVSISVGGMKLPFDRATVTLHRPDSKSPEEAVVELQGRVADLERTKAALEARIVELSETDPGR